MLDSLSGPEDSVSHFVLLTSSMSIAHSVYCTDHRLQVSTPQTCILAQSCKYKNMRIPSSTVAPHPFVCYTHPPSFVLSHRNPSTVELCTPIDSSRDMYSFLFCTHCTSLHAPPLPPQKTSSTHRDPRPLSTSTPITLPIASFVAFAACGPAHTNTLPPSSTSFRLTAPRVPSSSSLS